MRASISRLSKISCLIAVVCLAACASFSITSLYKLRHFKPATTDVNLLRFAVRVPDDMEIPKGGVRVFLGSEHSVRVNLQEEYILDSSNDRTALENVERQGEHLQIFQISSEDVERFNDLRKKIRVEKAQGADGTLEVKADLCHTNPELPSRIPISTFVNASETNCYVPLMLNAYALNGVARKTALELVPECLSQ